MKFDIIIIGSGLGGLACGAILAKAGFKVIVLEQASQIGGSIQSYKRKDLHFDTGLHYVGGLAEGQSLYKAFTHLGLLELPWKRMDDCFDLIQFRYRGYRLMQGWDNFVNELSKEFPDQHQALVNYADRIRNIRPEDMDVNAWDYLHETFSNETLINVLSASAMKLELRKESLPLFSFAHAQRSYIDSSWRLCGNGNMIVNHLCDTIRSEGGAIYTHSKVVQLKHDEYSVESVVLEDGRELFAEYIISDIHPQLLSSLLDEKVKVTNRWQKRNMQQDNTFGMFTVSLVLKPESIPYQNHNIYMYETANVWDISKENKPVSGVLISFRVPEDGSEYVSQIDLLTPMTWDECTSWADSITGHRPKSYQEMCMNKSMECIKLAGKAVPGLSDSISTLHISTPLTYRDYLSSPQGNAFGTRKDCNKSMLTFGTVKSPISNLLLTGQSVCLPGIEGVTMTAFDTCRHILGNDYINSILL